MVWFFVTVVVPLLAPFLLVPIFWILPISTHLKADAKLVAGPRETVQPGVNESLSSLVSSYLLINLLFINELSLIDN